MGRFVMRSDELLTAFLELERATKVRPARYVKRRQRARVLIDLWKPLEDRMRHAQ